MKKQRGQILIIIAVLFIAVLSITAILIDSSRLLIEKQELNRASAAGGKSGMIYVGNLMVTQAGEAFQSTVQARVTSTPGSLLPSPTAAPGGTDRPRVEDYLSDQDRAHLISPPVRTQVASEVKKQIQLNGFEEGKGGIMEIEVIYPFEYWLEKEELEIFIRISKRVSVMFSGFLEPDSGVIKGESRQSIPHR